MYEIIYEIYEMSEIIYEIYEILCSGDEELWL